TVTCARLTRWSTALMSRDSSEGYLQVANRWLKEAKRGDLAIAGLLVAWKAMPLRNGHRQECLCYRGHVVEASVQPKPRLSSESARAIRRHCRRRRPIPGRLRAGRPSGRGRGYR